MTYRQTPTSTFHATNPTDKWILVVDSFYMEFDSRSELVPVYDLIGEIDDSPFGLVDVHAPQSRDRNIYGEWADIPVQSFLTRVNPDYVRKHLDRDMSRRLHPAPDATPFIERHRNNHMWDNLF